MRNLLVLLSIVVNATDVILLVAGALLGVIATNVYVSCKGLMARLKNRRSLKKLPDYNPINDNICPLRQWNSRNVLKEDKTTISYDPFHNYDLNLPDISSCPYISNKEEWQRLYAEEAQKERKKRGVVSYITYISLDHNDNEEGRRLELKVSSCDYLGHHVNGKYLKCFPQDWEVIKNLVLSGDVNEYLNNAMPGNVFVNMIIINSVTRKMLVVKRSGSELNARNVWCIGGFETMNDLSSAINGSEEFSMHGIARRGLREEFTLGPKDIKDMCISSISFVKHLGFMVTALVRVELGGDEEGDCLTEGGLIERILASADSAYEHCMFKWVPISMREMRRFIKSERGYYRKVIQEASSDKDAWIGYTKWGMYEIWRNHSSIHVDLGL